MSFHDRPYKFQRHLSACPYVKTFGTLEEEHVLPVHNRAAVLLSHFKKSRLSGIVDYIHDCQSRTEETRIIHRALSFHFPHSYRRCISEDIALRHMLSEKFFVRQFQHLYFAFRRFIQSFGQPAPALKRRVLNPACRPQLPGCRWQRLRLPFRSESSWHLRW